MTDLKSIHLSTKGVLLMNETDLWDLDKSEMRSFHVAAGMQYHMFFNFIISNTNPKGTVRRLIDQLDVPLSFHEEHFFFCLCGIPKSIFTGVFGYIPAQYMRIFTPVRHKLLELISDSGWLADIFMITLYDEKQFGILMSPAEGCALTAFEMAGQINAAVQSAYEQTIFASDRRYCNVTALSGPFSSYDQIYEGYLEAKQIHSDSFFYMQSRVLTRQRLSSRHREEDLKTLGDACESIVNLLDAGQEVQCLREAQALFDKRLRHTHSFDYLRSTLLLLQHKLYVRCTVRGIADQFDFDRIANVESYHRIEECFDALSPVIRALCEKIRRDGVYPKTVLNAIYYIDKHCAEEISVPDIAEYAGVSAGYMSTIFKEVLHASVRDVITKARVDLAAKLLVLHPELRVTDVCERVCIHDSKYFVRVFKKHRGVTPGAYRASFDDKGPE